MYVLMGYDENDREIYVTAKIGGGYELTENFNLARTFEDSDDALDELVYLNDLQVMGKFPRVECLDIVEV